MGLPLAYSQVGFTEVIDLTGDDDITSSGTTRIASSVELPWRQDATRVQAAVSPVPFTAIPGPAITEDSKEPARKKLRLEQLPGGTAVGSTSSPSHPSPTYSPRRKLFITPHVNGCVSTVTPRKSLSTTNGVIENGGDGTQPSPQRQASVPPPIPPVSLRPGSRGKDALYVTGSVRKGELPTSPLRPVDAARITNDVTSLRAPRSGHFPATPAVPPRTPRPGRSGGRPARDRPVPTSPQNFRTRAHALAWRSDKGAAPDGGDAVVHRKSASSWFTLDHRPYLRAAQRAEIVRGTSSLVTLDPLDLAEPAVFHVDFTPEEALAVQALTQHALPQSPNKRLNSPEKILSKAARKDHRRLAKLIASLPAFSTQLSHRRREDVENYLADVATRSVSGQGQQLLRIKRDKFDEYDAFLRSSQVSSLLFARELAGMSQGYGSMRRLYNFAHEFKKSREDGLELRAEWTGCAGDIATITWVSNDGFLCGTTAHSDSHNQQYNKPGNLVLGSCSQGTLRAFSDHRVVRPLVAKGDNSTDAMRQSQDPWLYSSVVSSDYDALHDRAYTSSFDRTVKAWRVEKSGKNMQLVGTWEHAGNVNFVVASKHQSGMVATAADVPSGAVRVYDVDDLHPSQSSYRTYSCSRVLDLEGNPIVMDSWAYFPATIQWGLAPDVRHLLLVGYSPRGLTADDNDIPEDKRDSGEICLWDCLTGERVKLGTATTQNVFEVAWHPSQNSFIAATSPLGNSIEDGVRTQIRVFRPSDDNDATGAAFSEIKTLDCDAVDINELSIMPNSYTFCYITAGCTDGKTYVWDTAGGDRPIHVLAHGLPLEECSGDRERDDTGIKFTAWGTSLDRFYTGGSDGVVKVWNVRSARKPLVRDLLEVPAPVSYGMFSPDRSKLVIGDASGRVFLLSVDEGQEEKKTPGSFVQLPTIVGGRRSRAVRRPKALIPHPEPPPPRADPEGRRIEQEDTGTARARRFLETSQLERHPNPTVGVVQGARYLETGLFRRECHADGDPSKPLLAAVSSRQQETVKAYPPPRQKSQFRRLRQIDAHLGDADMHWQNVDRDLDLQTLSLATKIDLELDGVDIAAAAEDVVDYGFAYEDAAE